MISWNMLKKICCVLALCLLFSTCARDSMQESDSGVSSLGRKGKIFMQNLKSTTGWEAGWQDVTTRGTPLLDNLTINSRDGEGFYYLLPILSSDKTIEQFVVYGMNITVGERDMSIHLDKPVFVSKEIVENQPDLKKLVVSMKVYNILSRSGYVVDPCFIPDECKGLESRSFSGYSKFYTICYTYDGERYAPWEEDKSFLKRFLSLYNRMFSSSPYSCHMRLYSDHILVVFTGLPNDRISFYSSLNELVSEMKHYIPEVLVVPDKYFYDEFSDMNVSESDYPAGVYIKNWQELVNVNSYLDAGTPPPKPEIHIDHVDPCDYMTKRIGDVKFKEIMNEMMESVYDAGELIAYFTLNSSGRELERVTYERGEANAGEVLFQVDHPIDGIIHTHNRDGLPVFSLDDLIVPYMLKQDGNIVKGERFTMGLVTPNTTLFLFFDGNVYLDWMKKNIGNLKEYAIVYKNIFKITKDTPTDLAVEDFASLLKSWNIGITLMEKDPQSNRYKRVESKGGKIVKTICD